MILEQALFTIRPGAEGDFEAAFEQAKELLAAAPGFRSAELARGVEHPCTYLLLVRWERLEDHTEGFRNSDLFARWRALLGPFFDAAQPPAVEHHLPISHR
jgi:heme-degrading monooxygenase HmoA